MTDTDLTLLRAKLASVDETIAWCDGTIQRRNVSRQQRQDAMSLKARACDSKSNLFKAIAAHTLPPNQRP